MSVVGLSRLFGRLDRRHLVVALLLLLGLAAGSGPVREGLKLQLGLVQHLGRGAPAAFVAVCAVLTAAAVPGAALSAAAGFVFGAGQGAALSALGTTAGSLVLFAGGRLSSRGAIPDPGFWTVLLARLSPVVPFAPVAYGAGLTRMGWARFAAASAAGAPPCAWLYASLGSSALTRPAGAAGWLVHIAGLAATIGSLWLLNAALRRNAA